MNAEQLTNPRSNVLTFPTFERFRVPTFNLQPRRSGATFNPLHLILEKKKIQITIEEQILTAFRLSPVARLRSVSQLCTVHGQWSIVNLQSSTFGSLIFSIGLKCTNCKLAPVYVTLCEQRVPETHEFLSEPH